MAGRVPEDYTIETFRGDYDELERMAHASWRDEYGEASFPNFYRPAFLRYLIDRTPAKERDHVVAAYRGDRIIAFFLNLPQTFALRGELRRGAYSCLLVTRKDDVRQGRGRGRHPPGPGRSAGNTDTTSPSSPWKRVTARPR